jgi:NADPH-ferrihemoprotein reductase
VLDIHKPPKFFFFRILSFFCDGQTDSEEAETHKERLLEMSFDEYYGYCVKERRVISEILFDFWSVKLPLATFIQFIGFLKVREYSIASSNLVHPDSFHLLVASLEYETVFKRQVKGVCSQFFESLQTKDSIVFYIKEGLLRLPENIETPIILIGPGTGISPFISFIEERA